MFVKTQFDTIINLAEFEKIKIEWSVKSPNSENVHHIISAVSEERSAPIGVSGTSTRTSKSETLALFPQDMTKQAKNAYEYLFTALFQGETAFDMTHYTS